MKVAIIGAGPTGLVLSAALARRGHTVDVVDRDPGPAPDGAWPRKGVMQFHHAHAVRPQVTEALLAELPEAHERWLKSGAEPVQVDTPAGRLHVGTRSRRATLERAIRGVVEGHAGVRLHVGHVDRVAHWQGRARGLVVDGTMLEADVVIDASGRSSRVSDDLPPGDGIGAAVGMAYVDRQYQLHPGSEPGPLMGPIAWQADLEGLQTILFLHERGIFSVLFVRETSRRDLVHLRHDAVFDAVASAIPGLSEWTDPGRSRPLTSVLPGGQLRNHYRSQRTPTGQLRLPGLLSIGDAVCTTTPMFGRGLATSMMQVTHLLDLLDAGADPVADPVAAAEAFDDWCTARMRPWVEDHLAMDADQLRRWQPGADSVDLSRPLPSDRILAAGGADPEIQAGSLPWQSMTAGPEVMRGLEARARAVYETGWRPQPSEGPSRAELAATMAAALSLVA
jgi:2-polyprenyl-6-methoxyphenol hydroxylase-like FAD-dependent oxidoreductase